MAMAYSGGFNLDKLRQSLFMKAEHVETAISVAVEEAAELLVEEAKANAPVDTHNLEDAIHISDRQTRSGNTAIDIECSGDGSSGRDVSEYAMEVHERLYPAAGADLNLGPLSRAKQASDPTHVVGGKFMDRAMEAKKKEAVDLIKKAVRESLN